MTAFRNQGDQFRDNAGNILSAGSIYYYQASTNILQATYSDSGLSVSNSNPLLLDSDGRLDTPVFLGSTNDYKEIVKDSSGATISPWPVDNIPKTVLTVASSSYAPRLISWSIVTSATYAPSATLAGQGFELDTTSTNIAVTLPSAATVGNGKGFVFKKTAAANTITFSTTGGQTIDGSASSVTVKQGYSEIEFSSDGANWNTVSFYTPVSTTNDNAQAGAKGEFITSNVDSGSAVSLTSPNAKTITSISLTAGDWDVFGWGATIPAGGTTTTAWAAGLSTTADTLGTIYSKINGISAAAGLISCLPTPTQRFSLNATTTVYLIGAATFSASTLSAYGYISARRAR